MSQGATERVSSSAVQHFSQISTFAFCKMETVFIGAHIEQQHLVLQEKASFKITLD